MDSRDHPLETLSDAAIIARSRVEPKRFAVIFDRHYAAIRRYVARRVDGALADELTSETFLRAFAARAGYDEARVDARPWLYGIATNLLHKHLRTEERRRRAYARALDHGFSGGGLDGADRRADAAVLGPEIAAALARLQPGDRDALLLLALTDLDYEGVATALDVPVGTVRSRLNRARRQITNNLALHEGEPAAADATTRRSQT
jgi:RNA polymerase sigma-70 factor (ECF subfamily)